ncbi:aspartyl-phosphate phosphatase Spo0E family protein [Clostridium fermenticellae]|uniref:Aspartyl-phosphate phosphatase Spo0E family protein n=1 Tax=Clostridium fermenticellae TaxID=2068654 RepID=A0A386H1Z3_9CLOT|nr:aspartyl-phosphate phosphatase Spo0E family protein [Clostridium fermenticellae]AYD39686.1 aspartyl-phosphate phosphatase Spo0E family protein [Clostridium fermenticellae]
MNEIKEILRQIEDLKENLNNLINQKSILLDPKIIAASQMLDSILNEYDGIIKKQQGD